MRHSELTAIHGCDVKVSKLSLGTAPLGGLFKKVAESESDSVIREALDAGIAYIDTAPLYGYGVGEIRVGRGIKGCLLYTSPSPRDRQKSRMPSSA